MTEVSDSRKVADLEADIQALEAVLPEIQAEDVAALKLVDTAKQKVRSAAADYITSHITPEAMKQIHQGWDLILKGAMLAMSAHYLSDVRLADPKKWRPDPTGADDLYGPAAHLLTALNQLRLPSYNDAALPDWLRPRGIVRACDRPEVDGGVDAICQLIGVRP